jgi:hypothetical protein
VSLKSIFRGGGKPAKPYQEPKNQQPKITQAKPDQQVRSIERAVDRATSSDD